MQYNSSTNSKVFSQYFRVLLPVHSMRRLQNVAHRQLALQMIQACASANAADDADSVLCNISMC